MEPIISKNDVNDYIKKNSKKGGFKKIEVGNQTLKFKSFEVGTGKETALPFVKIVLSKDGYADIHEYYTLKSKKKNDSGYFGIKAFLAFIQRGLQLNLSDVGIENLVDLKGYADFLNSQLNKNVLAVVKHKNSLYVVKAKDQFGEEVGTTMKATVYFYGNDSTYVINHADKLEDTKLYGKENEKAIEIQLNTGRLRTVDEIYAERKAAGQEQEQEEVEEQSNNEIPSDPNDLPF